MYAMGCRATTAIKERRATREEYVAEMVAMRPRLNKAVWTPRLEQVYDATLRSMQRSWGACGTCGGNCDSFNSSLSIGSVPYHEGCEPKTMDQTFRSLRGGDELDGYRDAHQADTALAEDGNLIYVWADGSKTKMATTWHEPNAVAGKPFRSRSSIPL